jgi:hypothetical protein
MTEVREAGAGDKADITGTDDRDSHCTRFPMAEPSWRRIGSLAARMPMTKNRHFREASEPPVSGRHTPVL